MKTWYTIKDGRIDRIQDGETPAGEGDWKEAPADWNGNHGDKLEWFDENMRRIPDDDLVKQGRRSDNRGRVYNVEDQTQRIIHHLDEPLTENETQEAPLENEAFQFFDRAKKRWVVDTKKKERAEKETALGQVLEKIRYYEERGKRPNQEIALDIDVEENKKRLREFRNEITILRPDVNRLQRELEESA